MKKIIAGLAFAGLVSTGIAGTANNASAAPYPGAVETVTKVQAPAVVPAFKPVRVKVKVGTVGNVKASGKVRLVVRTTNGNKVKTVTADAGSKRVNLGRLPRGRYVVVVKFVPNDNSVLQSSRDSVRFRVGRR